MVLQQLMASFLKFSVQNMCNAILFANADK